MAKRVSNKRIKEILDNAKSKK